MDGRASPLPHNTPVAPDPDLMGTIYLMTWTTGVSCPPLTGMHLDMHLGMPGCFGIDLAGFCAGSAYSIVSMLVVYLGTLHRCETFSAAVRSGLIS